MSSPEKQQKAQDETTHFGFQTVNTAEKAGLVKDVFDQVAGKYDLMNDVMSGGLHRVWKHTMVESLDPRPDQSFLDVAGGTGDIAFRIRERTAKFYSGQTPQITLCDINDQMLQEGRKRALNHGIVEGIRWVCGDAMNLPVESSSVDGYTIAFGIRNVTDIDAALREANRVLKRGGRFLCLEFSHVEAEPLAKLYDAYSMHLIPRLGKLFAGASQPYQYLVESIRKFPDQRAFADKMRAAGFGNVSYRNMTGGVVALHSGWKI
ncbi:MAG: bifunctional demethylmenaquinone methyltransferase/2-methoxy-6-polyprenyl-1,4-benzoquinol methylase UbiE [Alphaproteobacteria bacterium]|nr:bifunctional demethylmenaquinone methyltransferase/2-methoxy-6-polyprenyl-1,4-benzoquinol methylase UbiE [Alphaproteobacteria bacterium]